MTVSSINGQLARSWKLALVAFLTALVSYTAFEITKEPEYSSDSVVYISNRDIGSSILRTSPSRSGSIANEARIANLSSVKSNAVGSIKLPNDVSQIRSMRATVPSTSTSAGQGALMELSVRSSSRELSKAVANRWANEFVLFRNRLASRELEQARSQLDKLDRSELRSPQERSHQEIDTIETLIALSGAEAQVIQHATSSTQVSPVPSRGILIGTVLGILSVIFVLSLRRLVPYKIEHEEQIERIIGAPVIGTIPRRGNRQHGQLVHDAEGDMSLWTEAFIALRSRLALALAPTTRKSILITSAEPAEGKSFVAANLAWAAAASGDDVLLIDADLRKPTIHTYFGKERSPGLVDAFVEGVDPLSKSFEVAPDDGNQEMWGRLRVVPAGTQTPSPSELCASQKMSSFVQSIASDEGVLVILDTPPALVVGDALSISGAIQSTLVVVGRTATEQKLGRLSSVLRRDSHNIVGVAFTNGGRKSMLGYKSYYYR